MRTTLLIILAAVMIVAYLVSVFVAAWTPGFLATFGVMIVGATCVLPSLNLVMESITRVNRR